MYLVNFDYRFNSISNKYIIKYKLSKKTKSVFVNQECFLNNKNKKLQLVYIFISFFVSYKIKTKFWKGDINFKIMNKNNFFVFNKRLFLFLF